MKNAKRIYQEEKARIEARSSIEKEQTAVKHKKLNNGCGIGCLVLVLIVLLLALISSKSGPVSYQDKNGLDTRDPDYKVLRDFADGKK